LTAARAPVAPAAAALLRAPEPTAGLDEMRARRGSVPDRALCAGPGRLTEALGITNGDDGEAINEAPVRLLPPVEAVEVVATPRVGITRAADLPWRYVVKGSGGLSRGPRRAPRS